jgi:hypothetical protein
MSDVTFRDFAGAIMQGDTATASGVLQTLLGLSPEQATTATAHFQSRTSDPSFMMKAMSLRTAVTSGSDDDIGALLEDCFGLTGDVRASAIAALRARYPRS